VKILGVDPGVHGALAIVEATAKGTLLVDAIDVPILGTGAKQRPNVLLLQEWLLQHGPGAAFIERAQAMPRQGASSGFLCGRAAGSLEAVITLCAIPLEIVEASAWKKYFRLPGRDKELARQKAISTFPASHNLFSRMRDHQRAEAARAIRLASIPHRHHRCSS
jgi:hypothetical protein